LLTLGRGKPLNEEYIAAPHDNMQTAGSFALAWALPSSDK
jgi:hypothetical protein